MAKGKPLQAIIDLAGTIDPSLAKAIDGAVGQLEKVDLKAVATGVAIGGIAIAAGKAVVEAGKYLKDLGAQFDDVTDSIRIGTGATGEALDALLADFDAVYKSVPTSMDAASQAVADFNTRLDLTGPALQDISKQAIQVSDMLGDDLGGVIESSSQAFKQWNINADGMGDAMDHIFKVSQSTGMGFTDLANRMQQYGPQLQEMGYSFETASALMGQMEKAGVNVDEVLGAMKKSVGSLAKEGISASDGIAMYYEQILNAGSAAEAAATANKIFGARAGSTMATAIRNGTLAVGDFTAGLMANSETISGAAADTYDFAENAQLFRQRVEVMLKPFANTVFDGLNDAIPEAIEVLDMIMPGLITLGETVVPTITDAVLGTVTAVAKVVKWFGEADGAIEIAGATIGTVTALVLAYNVQQALATAETTLWAVASGAATVATTALGTAFTFLTSPIGLTILAIGAAVAAGVMLYKNWDKVVEYLKGAGEKLKEFFTGIGEFLGNVFKDPINGIIENINGLTGSLSKLKIPDWVPLVGGKGVDIPEIPKLAAGGFTEGVSFAGEAGTEAVISFDPRYRSENLDYWAQAGMMLGAAQDSDLDVLSSGSSSTTIIDASGMQISQVIQGVDGDTADDLLRKLMQVAPELVDFITGEIERRERGRYAH